MRQILCILVILVYSGLSAGTYYSRSSGRDITSTDSWRSNRDGSGSSPSGFLLTAHNYIVQNGHYLNASGTWQLNSNSTVLIETGGKITTGSYDHSIKHLSMQSGGTYEMTHYTYFALDADTLDAASDFVINRDAGGIPIINKYSYGNLIIRQGSAGVGDSLGLKVYGTLSVETAGTFAGGGNYDVTNHINAVEVAGGTFYGSSGTGNVTYNIAGDVSISSGTFYGTYRSGTEDLPNTIYNLGGSFTNSGTYYARNRNAGGCPTYNFSGYYEELDFANSGGETQSCHKIEIMAGSRYTLSGDVYMHDYRPFTIRGILDAGTCSVRSSTSTDMSVAIYGHVKTAHPNGLYAYGSATFCILNPSSLSLASGSTIEYYAVSSQTFSPHLQYRNVVVTGEGNKTIAGSTAVSIATSLILNGPLVNNGTLVLNGSLGGYCPISGCGSLTIGENAAALNLLPCTQQSVTVNRTPGCNMAGDLITDDLTVSLGTLHIGPNTLTINDELNIYISTGALSGNSASTLVINYGSSEIYLPSLNLGYLTVNRTSYNTIMNGNINVYNILHLQSGILETQSWTLTLYGTVSRVNGSIHALNGTVTIAPGTGDITMPASNIGHLVMNRAGYNCNPSDGQSIGLLEITGGIFAIGTNSMYLYDLSISDGGQFTGGSSSILYVAPTHYMVLPPLELDMLYVSSYYCHLSDPTVVRELYLDGYLYVPDGVSLTINQNLYGNYGGHLQGDLDSHIYYNGINTFEIGVPRVTAGHFHFNHGGTSRIVTLWMINSSLHLDQGVLAVDSTAFLVFGDNATIYRSAGSIAGVTTFGDIINVVYEADLTTGPEIPGAAAVLQDLLITGGHTVTANRDISLAGNLTLDDSALVELGDCALSLAPGAVITSGLNAWIFGRAEQEIGSGGFNAPALGVVIAPGAEVTGFAVTHKAENQILPYGTSIDRTWSLEGSFTGSREITFLWNSTADNGLDFISEDALVLAKEGLFWKPAGDPADVSLLNPRLMHVTAEHFSDWTVSTAGLLFLPVVNLVLNHNYGTEETELNWSHPFAADHFNIYRSSNPAGPFDTLAGSATGTFWSEPQTGTQNFYQVRAVND